MVAIRPLKKLGGISGKGFSLENGDEDDDDSDDIIMLEKKVKSCNMPEQALKVCTKEMKR